MSYDIQKHGDHGVKGASIGIDSYFNDHDDCLFLQEWQSAALLRSWASNKIK